MSARGLLAKTDEGLQRVELLVICACLAAILVAVSGNVISRSFSLRWPDASEVALMSMAALTFIGSAYAVARRAHITIDLGEMISSSRRLKRGLAVATELLIAAVSLLFIVYGGDLLAYVVRMDERSAGLELPLWIPIGSLWLGSALSLVHLILGWAMRLSAPADDADASAQKALPTASHG